MTTPRPFQRLDDRLAGKPLDEVLLPGVPEHLVAPLRGWLADVLYHGGDEDLAQAVVVALRLKHKSGYHYVSTLTGARDEDLLTVVDAVLHFVPEYYGLEEFLYSKLERLLLLGNSAYKLTDRRDGLAFRVDPTAEAAFRQAVQATNPTAADLLRAAWHHAYKPNPDPTTAYREAVRAVEEVACPLILPNAAKPTLGSVIAHLRDAPEKWETVLVDRDGTPGDPTPVRELLDRLWTGQVSRHGGGKTSREQDQAEAEAAVHVAVLAVQWLTSGVLRRKP